MGFDLPPESIPCPTCIWVLTPEYSAAVPRCSAGHKKTLTCDPFWRQDRLVEEAGAEAILCLQSGLCHEALQIDWPAIRERALERGVVITRVAVRDFDHNDQVLGR